MIKSKLRRILEENWGKFYKKYKNRIRPSVISALSNAYYIQAPDRDKKLIFHSDLGSQYTSNDIKDLCGKLN